MAGDKQPKTKAELLRELQSIQHLLNDPEDEQFPALDDDDIPLLDAFLDEDDESEPEQDEPLASDKETLDALNAAYAALTGDLDEAAGDTKQNTYEKTPEKKPSQQPVAQAAPRSNAPSHPQQTAQAHQSTPAHAKPRAHEPEYPDPHEATANLGFTPATDDGLNVDEDESYGLTHTDPSAPAPLPGQQSLFEPIKKVENTAPSSKDAKATPDHNVHTDDHTQAGKEAHSFRPAQVTKASGENPFLPQHIRERLRGNQPLPQGEFLLPMTQPAYMDLDNYQQPEFKPANTDLQEPAAQVKAPSDTKPAPQEAAQDKNSTAVSSPKNPDIAAIINDIIDEFLPLIEARLRKRLIQALSDEEPREH